MGRGMSKRPVTVSRRHPYGHAMVDSSLRLSAEQREFLERRTRPFLDVSGMERPIVVLLEEAYLQGIRDCVQVLTGDCETNGDAVEGS